MARGRMIATTVADDKRLNGLSLEAELVYLKTIPHLDRDGLILGEPLVLWGKVCRRRPELMSHMEAIIAEWVDSGLVISYVADDDTVLFFKGFAKNQTGIRYDREAESQYATPPGWHRNGNGLEPDEVPPPMPNRRTDNSGGTPDKLRSESGLTPPQIKVKQSKLNQTKPTTEPAVVVVVEPSVDKKSGAVFSCWMDNMPGTMTPIIQDDLNHLIDEYGCDEVIRAIGIANEANARNMRYVRGVLQKRASGKEPVGRQANAPPSKPSVITVPPSISNLS